MPELNETIKVIERETCITLVTYLRLMANSSAPKYIRKTAKTCVRALNQLIDEPENILDITIAEYRGKENIMIRFTQPTLGDDDTIVFTTAGHACIAVVLSKLDAYRSERKAIKGEVEYLNELYAQKKEEKHSWIRTN